jgi:histidinol phosphatase-like enzyme
VTHIRGKIEDIMEELGFLIQAFVAGATDKYRKPNNTMWELFTKDYNSGLKLENPIYVGGLC